MGLLGDRVLQASGLPLPPATVGSQLSSSAQTIAHSVGLPLKASGSPQEEQVSPDLMPSFCLDVG